MSVSVRVDTKKLDEIIAKLPNNRNKILSDTAAHILFVSQQTRVYKDVSGELRSNALLVDHLSSGFVNVEYYAEYAPYVELGTWKMAARPFLKPAAEAEAKLLEQRIKDGLIQK